MTQVHYLTTKAYRFHGDYYMLGQSAYGYTPYDGDGLEIPTEGIVRLSNDRLLERVL